MVIFERISNKRTNNVYKNQIKLKLQFVVYFRCYLWILTKRFKNFLLSCSYSIQKRKRENKVIIEEKKNNNHIMLTLRLQQWLSTANTEKKIIVAKLMKVRNNVLRANQNRQSMIHTLANIFIVLCKIQSSDVSAMNVD